MSIINRIHNFKTSLVSRKHKNAAFAFVVAAASLSSFNAPVAHAAGLTFTWAGGGGDQLISNPANWVGGVAPGADDSIVFPPIATSPSRTINVDTSTAYALIQFSGDCTSVSNDYLFTGPGTLTFNTMLNNATGCGAFQFFTVPVQVRSNPAGGSTNVLIHNAGVNGLIFGANFAASPLTFDTNGMAISLKGIVRMGSVLTGTGSIALDPGVSPTVTDVSVWSDSPSFGGTILVKGQTTLNSNHVGALGNATGNTTVETGGGLQFATNGIVTEPISLTGTPALLAMLTSTGGTTLTLNGGLTQTADFPNVFINGAGMTLVVGGCQSGFAITGRSDSTGTLTDSRTACSGGGTGTQDRVVTTVASGDNQPAQDVTVAANNTLLVNGTRGNITVQSGGILGGNGTVGTITVQSGGKLAPGNSPGCLASGNVTLVSGANYDVDIAGATVCTEYDQQVVTGTVDLGSATLNVVLTYVPAAGAKFKIISNDAADPIVGTFAGLTEGATVTANGYNFTISYIGGDGNDVELTAVGPVVVPALPAAARSNGSAPLLLVLFAILSVTGIEIGRRARIRR